MRLKAACMHTQSVALGWDHVRLSLLLRDSWLLSSLFLLTPIPSPRLPTVTALRMQGLCPGAQQGLLFLFELPDCPHPHPQPSAQLCLPVTVTGNSRCWDNKSCFRSQGCCQAQLHSDWCSSWDHKRSQDLPETKTHKHLSVQSWKLL